MLQMTFVPSAPSQQRLTGAARILAILAAVARFGAVTSEQAARLDGGSRKKVTLFLADMVAQGLIRRAKAQASPLLTGYCDLRPNVFGITAKGLRVLAEAGIHINVRPKKADVLLAHEVEITEAMFRFYSAVAGRADAGLLDEPEVSTLFPPATQALSKPLQLPVVAEPRDFPHLTEILTKPTPIPTRCDRLIALAYPDNTASALALEIDRSTENLRARQLRGKASYLRKVLGYTASFLAGTHVAHWGVMFRALRVGVITQNETRIANMLDIQKYVGAPAGMFVYSTPERLEKFGALGSAWITAKRDNVCLLDRD